MECREAQRRVWIICLVLALVTFALYARVLTHGFVSFDDYGYVTENESIQNGVTPAAVVWAFTTGYADNWHPVTWISHMLDCQFYGLQHPGGHHLTNLLFHIANALLLFLVLKRMTGAVWRSALVAALFAWHPLHVESVAWIAERKDVLSTFFWLLTLLAYVRYVQAFKVQGAKLKVYYRWVLAFFALGLMSKPMLVTLPFVLLLLDYWPLGRNAKWGVRSMDLKELAASGRLSWEQLVMEKVPMIGLALLSSVVTFLVQSQGGAVMTMQKLPFPYRVANSLLAYAGYLRKTIWPSDLAIFYPFPKFLLFSHVLGAALLLILISVAVTKLARPYLLFGWLWFLGTLVPVIGLVQVGSQSMADRYSYMPLVGIFVIFAWGAAELLGKFRLAPSNLGWVMAAPLLAVCLALTWRQVPFWKNSETLFRHDLAVTTNNILAHANLGRLYDDTGRPAEAAAEFVAALKIDPRSPATLTGMGVHFAKLGDMTNALNCYKSALREQPLFSDAHYNLGNVLAGEGNFAEAAKHYAEAVRLKPDAADAHNNLGAVLLRLGQPQAALDEFQNALRLKPNFPEAQDQLGSVLLKLGHADLAQIHFEEAVRLKPDFAHAQLKLGVALAQQGALQEAVVHLLAALKLEPQNADAHFNLAAAYAALNRLQDAAQSFKDVLRLRPDDVDALARRAWILATAPQAEVRNGIEAVRLAERANELTSRSQPQTLSALDVAYAEAGRFEDAIKTAEAVQQLAISKNQKNVADLAARRIELYRAGKPFHQ